jgi:V/A-type H+-transporting ATPase subunit D
VEETYRTLRRSALLAKAPFPEKSIIDDYLSAQGGISLTLQSKNQMGVLVPIMSFDIDKKGDEFLSLSPALSQTKRQMESLLPHLLQLAQIEKHCVILSAEIEKTRRRVNALEYMTIPQLKETIRFIKMRLEDSERDRITRLIKMQDLEVSAEY